MSDCKGECPNKIEKKKIMFASALDPFPQPAARALVRYSEGLYAEYKGLLDNEIENGRGGQSLSAKYSAICWLILAGAQYFVERDEELAEHLSVVEAVIFEKKTPVEALEKLLARLTDMTAGEEKE